MSSSPPRFSLLDEPWILCGSLDGTPVELGLLDVFDGKHPIKRVRGDAPTQDSAIVGLLLPIYWRAHTGDLTVSNGDNLPFSTWFEEHLEQARSSVADEAVLNYLETYRDRFFLVGGPAPFMQTPTLETKNMEFLPLSRLIPEAESEYFSMREEDAAETVPLGEAARWIVTTQAYDYSGIKPGAIGDDRVKGGRGYPIGVGWSGMTGRTLIVGNTFAETLVYNTTADCISSPEDKPCWERPVDTAAVREFPAPKGAADLLTWQTRRIRVRYEGDRATGVIVTNGDKIPDAGANVFGDPLTPYRYSKNKSKKGHTVYYPQCFDTNRTMWRSLVPLVALDSDPQFTEKDRAPKRPRNLDSLSRVFNDLGIEETIPLELISASYGPQDSTPSTTVHAVLNLPSSILQPENVELRDQVVSQATATSTAAVALGSFAGQLLQAAGGDYEFQPAPTDGALAELEHRFNAWLSTVDEDQLDELITQWQDIVYETIIDKAEILLRGAGPKALVGRLIPPRQEGGKPWQLTAGTAFAQLRKKLLDTLSACTASKHRKEKGNRS
ncbi:type I-E CRISPR-associated protein Cse1/CasA [Corynebacterium glucuronolyticum]|uniref:type I-E CRISPR-associated protein Cse1/CasA n=1 Tax=Corynebacterium glucuronolyticum TaxID=39791 RepID=UPI0021AEFB37|nr:type I-E CRISPR-associated protein Cse1/CasA [Corynebacterium glucuronolyticum]MCT1563043.1 type I-E CRISPR-associated protein Cse1/CasA [Corynebacterium glucuronolyticum]